MRLIIDTSSIISALIKNGTSRRIIFSSEFQFLTPEHTLKEIAKYKNLICKKAKIDAHEFEMIFQLIFEKITIRPKEEYTDFISASRKHIDDIDDVPFIALYLALNADGIWSDDTHFKTKDEILIYRTKDLFSLL